MSLSGSSPQLCAPSRTGGFAPLRDYAVIGNKRTAALVALDGAIDWLPLPTLAGASAFAAVLDPQRGGRMTLSPTVPFQATRRYLPDTNVLETTFVTSAGSVRITDAMSRPIAHSLVWNQVIRRVDGLEGEVPMAWTVEPRFGYGARSGHCEHSGDVPVIVDGPDVVAVEAFDLGEPHAGEGAVRGEVRCTAGDIGALAVSAFHAEPLSFSSRDFVLARLDETAERWRRWVADCPYDGPWREAVRRSALALDLLVDDETGAIAAAATMGLPERIGGSRNFDYRYAWLRDENLTLEAMQRLGFRDQVHRSLRWILDAVHRTGPWLRPMYRLDGDPRLPDRRLDLAGYCGSRPVLLGNGAQGQLQLESFGDVFDMTHRYVERGGGLAAADADVLADVADFLCRVWRRPDASLWELQDRQDYTQSKLASALALDRAAKLAERGTLPGDRGRRWRETADEVARYVRERCWSESRRAYVRAPGSDELDAGILLAARGSFLRDDPDRLSSTIDAIRDELGAGGPLLYRYSGMADQEGAFLACSFWLAEALARVGRMEEAGATMDALVGLANDVGLYSEEIDPVSGEFLGNLPQALSHLALVNAASVIERLDG